MGEDEIKITDKRMFTPDGELREEFRHLETDAPPESKESPPAESVAPKEESRQEPEVPPEPEPAPPTTPQVEPAREPVDPQPDFESSFEGDFDTGHQSGPGGQRSLTFLDLVGLLAEPIALYLGDMQLPDGKSAENLEMARLHIDLLEVLRTKTTGNLDAEEKSLLDDLLYRLRMRYVQKKG